MREEASPLPIDSRALSREERLAAKLRENLKRRKGQAREFARDGAASLPKTESDG